MIRIILAAALLLKATGCADPATTFAGGLRGWCKSAANCTAQD